MSSLASDLSNQQMQIVESRNPQVHQQQQLQQPQQQPSHIQQPPQNQSNTSIVSTIAPTASTSHQHQQQQQQQPTTTNINVNLNQNLDDFLMINANVDTNSVTESNLSVLSVVPISDTNNTRNQNNSIVVTTTNNSPNSKQQQLVVSQTNTSSSVLLTNKLSAVGVQGETENLSVIKKRILEHKYLRLRSIKEK
jgi:hypothetical protein